MEFMVWGRGKADTNQFITQIYNELFTRYTVRVEGSELACRGTRLSPGHVVCLSRAPEKLTGLGWGVSWRECNGFKELKKPVARAKGVKEYKTSRVRR